MNKLALHIADVFLVDSEYELLPSETEILEFIQTDAFKSVLTELTNGVNVGAGLAVDDGPNYHYANHEIYKKVSEKRAEQIGWSVVDYLLRGGKDGENPNAPAYPNGPVRSVSFFPAGIAGIKTPTNQEDLVGSLAWDKWLTHVTRRASLVGYSLVHSREERIRTAKDKKQAGIQSRADVSDEKDHRKGGLAESFNYKKFNTALDVSQFSEDVKVSYRINEDDGPNVARKKLMIVRDLKESGIIFEDDFDGGDKAIIKHLIDFTIQELGINKRPPIKLTSEREDISTTAYYNPHTFDIKIYTYKRALADYLRSIAHELVHHKQNEDGRLGATAGDGSKWAIDSTDPLETEAHALAGDVITKFNKISEKNIYMNEAISIDVNVGDTILTGKFKNKKTVVKEIGTDEHGMPTINGRKVVTFRKQSSVDETVTRDALDQVEKFADKVLAPLDVEFTKHFFDRVNDPRNQKDISSAELISFFKRLATDTVKLKSFLQKYRELVVGDKRTGINIPFVNRVDSIIAKTVMRKYGFQTNDPKLTIN